MSLETSPREICPEVQARNFCFFLKDAAEKVGRAAQLELDAQHSASRIIAESIYGDHQFRLLVKVPPEVRSVIKQDYEVVEENPESFEASEVTSINRRGVQFWDHLTDKSLIIYGHEFEITPIF